MYNWVLIFTFITYPVMPSGDYGILAFARTYYNTKKECEAVKNSSSLSTSTSKLYILSECIRAEKDYTWDSPRKGNYYSDLEKRHDKSK